MRKLSIRPLAALTALALGLGVASLWLVYPQRDMRTAACRQAVDDPWDELDETEKVTGRVRSLLIEITEMGTSEPPEELSRSPFLELEFDHKGRILKKVGFRDDGVLLPPRTYEYDEQGRLIRANYYEAIKGEIYIVTEYSYDMAGRPHEAISKSIDSYPESELSKVIFSHTPENNYSEKAKYWGEALRYKFGYIRDDCGMVVELLRLSEMIQGQTSLKYMGKTVFYRDTNGHITKAESYDNEGNLEEVVTMEYVFDAGGNWVKRTTWRATVSNGELSKPTKEVVYRSVTYF